MNIPMINTIGTSGIPWPAGAVLAVAFALSSVLGLLPMAGSGAPFFSSNGTGESKKVKNSKSFCLY